MNKENYENETYGKGYTARKETEKILQQRDKVRYLEELSDLESEEASHQTKIFWNCFSLLIVNPALLVGTIWYFYGKIKEIIIKLAGGTHITNLGDFWTNLKWTLIGIAAAFILNILYLLWNLYQVSSTKQRIARLRRKVYRIERDLSKI